MFKRYKNFRPFSETEAWVLFKLAAFAEAIGWTLLILGIFCKYQLLGGNNAPVAVAGQIHGTLFLAYIAACLVLAPSLGWSLPRTVLAGLFSVPPYGSLVYEQISAHLRNRGQLRRWHSLLQYRLATKP